MVAADISADVQSLFDLYGRSAAARAARSVRSSYSFYPQIDLDSLHAAALWGAWRAAETYDVSRNDNFTRYAFLVARRHAERWAEGERRAAGAFAAAVENMVADYRCPGCDEVDANDSLSTSIRDLPITFRVLARVLWSEGLSAVDAAEAFGLSRHQVDRIVRTYLRPHVAARFSCRKVD